MDYLSKQFDLVKRSLRYNIPLEDTLAIKFYIQRLMADCISKYLSPNSKILEVGVGGSLTIHLLSKMGHKCYGIDNNPQFIDYSNYLKSKLDSNSIFKEGDAFSIPYPDNYFDYVYSVGVIEHYKENNQILFCKEMSRVSRQYIHLEVPNYKETSSFYSFLAEEEEPHYPYHLNNIIHQSGARAIEDDARGVFNILRMLKKNNSLYTYIKKHHHELIKHKYRSKDIKALMEKELLIDIDTRKKYGFQVYVIGEINE